MQLAAYLISAAIALGAFGKHGLTGKVGERELEIFETAARYHMYNALALLILGLAHAHYKLPRFSAIRVLILTGLSVFCVSLYVMSTAPLFTVTSLRWLGAITPIGGVCLISGWLMAGISFGKILKK